MRPRQERRGAAWLLCLALMAVGGLIAHVLAYRLVWPDAGSREHVLAHTGHDYLSEWRLCLAVCATVGFLGLGASVLESARERRPACAPLWIFGLVPPLGFVVQEHVERLLQTGAFPYAAVLEPTFVVGIVLQVPIALLAYFVARALLAVADALARTLGGLERPRLASVSCWRPRVVEPGVPLCGVLALGYGQRAPPPIA